MGNTSTWLGRLDDWVGQRIGRPDRVAEAVEEELSERAAPTIYTSRASDRTRGIPDRKEPSLRKQREAYFGTFFTVVNLRATTFAEACKLLEAQRMVGGEWKPQDMNDPWAQMLARPSRVHPKLRLYSWWCSVRDLAGKGRLIVERDTRTVPMFVHPVYREFGRMQPVGNESGEIFEFKFHPTSGGGIRTFPAEDVIEWTRPDLWTPYESMSLIEAAAYQIDAESAMHVYRKDNLREGGFSDIYLKSDQDLNEKQIRTYQRQMQGYRGPKAAKTLPVLGKGLSIETATRIARDLQFVEGAKLTHDDIFEIGGVPLALTAPDANLANAKAAFRVFYMITIQPLVNDFAETLSHQFERSYGSKPGALRVHAPNIVPVDQEEESRVWQRLVQSGLRLINEYRESKGLNAIEGGDTALIPSFYVSAKAVSEEGTVQFKDDPDEKPAKKDKPKEAAQAVIDTRLERDATKAEAELWVRNDKKKQNHSNRIEAGARRLFDEQKRSVLAAIADERQLDRLVKRDGDDEPHIEVDEIFDIGEWIKRAQEIFGPLINGVVKAGFENAIELLESEVDFTSSDPEVKRIIREINAKSKEVVETTSRDLEDEVQVGLEAGETREQIAKRLADRFHFISDWRSPVIGWTMATGGFEGGQLVAFEKAEVEEKIWLTQRDGRVRASHQKAHRQQVKVDEKFKVGESSMKHPGDPDAPAKEVIRCRCSMAPVLTKE